MSAIRHLIVLDDREEVSSSVRSVVGTRTYGEIIIRRRSLRSQFAELAAIPDVRFIEVNTDASAEKLIAELERFESLPVTVLAARSIATDQAGFTELIKRLGYLGKSYFSSEKEPLLAHFKNAKELLRESRRFLELPIHLQDLYRESEVRTDSPTALNDISGLDAFLKFVLKGTEARHFNEVEADEFVYTKRSRDKQKISAEFKFYYLLPPQMQPWFVQPYNFNDAGETASYEMLRYHLADASLQWIHRAWTKESFTAFLSRINFFFRARSSREFASSKVLESADHLFLKKVQLRVDEISKSQQGLKLISILESAGVSLGEMVKRYEALYAKFRPSFDGKVLVVGHGDPCLSNILYDQHHMILKLIDPRGASAESDLWVHPLYDYCKLSHSIDGDYDFINHGLFDVGFGKNNDLKLSIHSASNLDEYKDIHRREFVKSGGNLTAMKIGECSLFLSMIPLHLDHPNKALAFALNAERILKEIEQNGN